MIFLILKSLLFLLLAIPLMLVLKDVMFLINSRKYFKQKIHSKYSPLLGIYKYLGGSNINSPNQLTKFIKMFEIEDKAKNEKKTADLLLVNFPGNSTPALMLHDKDLLRDFAKIETEVSRKQDMARLPILNSFMYMDGKSALEHRTIFSEIFYPSNLKKMTKNMKTIIERQIQKIKQKLKNLPKNEQGFTAIELKQHTEEIFTDLVSYVLFGEDVPLVGGVKLTKLIVDAIGVWMQTSRTTLNILTFGLYRRMGFDPNYLRAKDQFSLIKKTIQETIQERKNSAGYVRGVNAIDLILDKNEKLEEEGKPEMKLSMDSIVDTMILLIFAGMDTSKNTSEFSLYHLSKNQALQERLRAEVVEKINNEGQKYSYEAYDENVLINLFLKEILRVDGPAWISFSKHVTKDFKLGRYTIYKGTILIISYAALHQKNEYWDNPDRFDMARFEDTARNRKFGKHGYQPFALGKRACIGKNLGEISIKLLLASFLDAFEVMEPDEQPRKMLRAAFGLSSCKVKLRAIEAS